MGLRGTAAHIAARATLMLAPSRLIVDRHYFKDRRVILVGPAETALQYMDGVRVDDFDVVVRINSSQRLVLKHGSSIGYRTDVLAHSLFEGGPRGTGRIDPELMAQQRTSLVLCPLPNPSKWAQFYEVRRRLGNVDWSSLGSLRPQVLTTPPRRYRELCDLLRGRAPTTGLATMDHLLHAGCRELHVTGFTFFTTAYSSGYKPGVEDSAAAMAWSAASKHDVDRECSVMAELVDSARNDGAVLRLDGVLETLLSAGHLPGNRA